MYATGIPDQIRVSDELRYLRERFEVFLETFDERKGGKIGRRKIIIEICEQSYLFPSVECFRIN